MVQSLLACVWEGGIGTVFAYGQTGSGKTYIISGIEQFLANSLFETSHEIQRKLHVSIFEIVGNSAFGKILVNISIEVPNGPFQIPKNTEE